MVFFMVLNLVFVVEPKVLDHQFDPNPKFASGKEILVLDQRRGKPRNWIGDNCKSADY
jgi:hypothetical protein